MNHLKTILMHPAQNVRIFTVLILAVIVLTLSMIDAFSGGHHMHHNTSSSVHMH